MRRLITFPCALDALVGTLDEAAGPTGLLIVSGGNEVRAGAHRGMALLASDVAALGYPVFRYDRRGVGDSTGANCGFLSSEADLHAAVFAFRTEAPHVRRLVGFGNCDAASTLALFGRKAGIDAVLLANPWTIEDDDGLPPAAAIRARYAGRLFSPAAWWRLARGQIDLRRLAGGMWKIARRRKPRPLADRVVTAVERWGDRAAILVASGDAAAIAFRHAAPHLAVEVVDTGSHSFARAADRAALRAAVLRRLSADALPPS